MYRFVSSVAADTVLQIRWASEECKKSASDECKKSASECKKTERIRRSFWEVFKETTRKCWFQSYSVIRVNVWWSNVEIIPAWRGEWLHRNLAYFHWGIFICCLFFFFQRGKLSILSTWSLADGTAGISMTSSSWISRMNSCVLLGLCHWQCPTWDTLFSSHSVTLC